MKPPEHCGIGFQPMDHWQDANATLFYPRYPRNPRLISASRMRICDLTQFYSPFSGGVKRYVHEKIAFIQNHSPDDEHILIVPGSKTEVTTAPQSRIYSIHSPLLSRTSRYRALINLRAVEEIFERERPDLIESSDPYQLAWKAITSGGALGIPVVAFYHSHFPEAYLRSATKFLGLTAREAVMDFARRYVRNLYNQFVATLVPSPALGELLSEWGVNNVRLVNLGVNIDIFNPDAEAAAGTRHALTIKPEQRLLLYVGRLAKEKNTNTLFAAFEMLEQRRPGDFHLLVIGDGPQREQLTALQARTGNVSWIQYCNNSADLARYYCAADLFVHPGVQETFGLVTLESQACGTPVVGIRGSSMDRIIFHEQETWARENSPQALADAIEESSEKPLSTLGRDAAQVAETSYSWQSVFEQLFCIYRQVCANYRRS
ncbi:MAG TPA: glycosyltransferase [Chthoniobacterales bacterium]|jgi:alpha-1,6-mannosyltransferase